MPDPIPSFYENDSTPSGGTILDNSNPLLFGSVPKSSISVPSDVAQSPIHVWNDKNVGTAKAMTQVKVGMKDSAGGNTGEFISGTALNGNKPFFEAKSNGSSGCPDDGQAAFTPIGGNTYLSVGDIPANARRHIYVRMNAPADAASGLTVLDSKLVIDYSFEA